MKTETNNHLAAYQQQEISATQEISEALFEGIGRIENVWLEQTSKIFEEQLKLMQATMAARDIQGLSSLQQAFFSRSPEDFAKAQQQVLSVVTDTQTKISHAMGKRINALKAEAKPLWDSNATDSASGFVAAPYLAWRKAFQDAIELASIGFKVLPLSVPNATRGAPARKKEEAHAKPG